MKIDNIESVINSFKEKSNPNDRYSSFDYCYNYFHPSNQKNQDVEKSCLVIGFYLASWGMYRGSSFLLRDKSVKHFEKLVDYIHQCDKEYWNIDVDKYDNSNIETIIKIYNDVKERVIPNNETHLTLVTKILLGVFGFIPAFDDKFCTTFRILYANKCGFRVVNEKSLNVIKSFYVDNDAVIDQLSQATKTKEFYSGQETNRNYTKAKIIDMFGFSYQ